MAEEDIIKELRLKNTDKTRHYFFEEIKQSELMSRKHKKICLTLNYIENCLILPSTNTGCIWVSAFTSLVFLKELRVLL